MKERDIFLAALDRDPAERAAFLDEACGGDAALRRGVAALLRLQGQTHGFLDVPAVEQLAALTPPATPERDAAADGGTLPPRPEGPGQRLPPAPAGPGVQG
jgi:serine/threonine-protein kinase